MKIVVAPSCRAVLNQANALWPNRSKASDGTIGDAKHRTRKSDHNPDENGIVHAVDLTHDPKNGCDAHKLARQIATRRDVRINYIISNGQICSSYPTSGYKAWEWRPYSGSNKHKTHAHFSIYHTDAARNNTSPWFSTVAQSTPTTSPSTSPAPNPVYGPFKLEDTVLTALVITLGARGGGWKEWDPGFVPAAWGTERQGPNPAGLSRKGIGTAPRDGYWYESAEGGQGEPRETSSPHISSQIADGMVLVSVEGGKPFGTTVVYVWAVPESK